jgi:hypothetical protein
MIKPSFWEDEKLAIVSRDARLTYIAMWNFSDDYGVIKGHYNWLKNTIYPYECEITIELFSTWMKELEELKRIVPFKVSGERYYFMPKFIEHQVINRPSNQRNAIPPFEISGDSLNTHDILIDEKKEKEKEKRKRKIPNNIILSESMKTYANSKGVFKKHEDIFEEFCIYHRKKGSKFAEWDAAWQTWVRSHVEWKGKDAKPQYTTAADIEKRING